MSLAQTPTSIIYVRPAATGAGDGSSWNDATTLQDALATATSGAEIRVAAGVYSPGSDSRDAFTLVEGVAVYGGFAGTETDRSQRDPATNLTVLSGDIDNDDTNKTNGITPTGGDIVGTNNQGSRGFVVFPANASAATVLDGVTITAGQSPRIAEYGGAITISDGNATLTNIRLIGNASPSGGGGGISIRGGSPTLTDLTFEGNLTDGRFRTGGGLLITDGNPSLTGLQFSNNQAPNGGGIGIEGGTPTIENTRFLNNTADQRGGGLSISDEASPTLRDLTFEGNQARDGGGMAISGGTPTVESTRFLNNTAEREGGGLFVRAANPTLSDLTFEGNLSEMHGGGMYVNDSTLTLTDVLFQNNDARSRTQTGEGGGLYITSISGESDVTITGGRFIENRVALRGAGIHAERSTLTATDVQFIGNDQSTSPSGRGGRTGGGMTAEDTALTLTNALFSGNNSDFSAVDISDSAELYTSPDPRTFLTNVSIVGNTGTALNCTSCRMQATNLSIAGNYSQANSGGIDTGGTEGLVDLRNSIVWGNETGGAVFIDPNVAIQGSVEFIATHTLIEGQNPPGTGNLDGTNTANDPRFVAAPNPFDAPTRDGDLRLQEGSPAIDAGDTALIAAAPAPGDTIDLAGNARVADGTVDLGAYESGNQPAPDPEPFEEPIRMVDSGQSLTPGGDLSSSTAAVLLGDVDNDNDLDAITFSGASATGAVQLWLNQGGTQGGVEGVFSLGQQLASRANRRGALGDIDGDGDLDLLMPLFEAGVRVWLNQGGAQNGTLGTFADNDAPLGTAENVYNVALGDLDNDGDPDAIYAAREDTFFARNDGGTFTDVDSFPVGATRLIPADLDGDNDLDLVLDSENITVLLNQATEVTSFTPGQRIDNLNRNAMTVGDVDGDGDLDMIATVDIRRARVFLNQGGQQGGTPATFEQDNQQITIDGSLPPLTIAAGDLNNDDDLDLLVGGARIGGPDLAIWQNDGAGLFAAGETYPGIGTFDLALGDLDGDGDLDAFLVGAGPHRIFLNGETDIAPMLRFGVDPLTGDGGRQYIFWWERFNARLPLLLSHPVDDPLTLRVDFVRQTGLLELGDPDTDNPQFAPGETRVFLTGYEDRISGVAGTIWNPYQDPEEDRLEVDIVASINRESRSAAGLDLRGEENLRISFQNPDADARRCIAIGFQIVIASLFNQDRAALAQDTLNLELYRALRDDVLAQSEAGRYYTEVYADSSLDMLQVAGQQSGVISRTLETLETWEPAMQALVDGEGDTVTITPEMVESMQVALDDYKTFGSADLASTIASAEAIVDLDSYVGLTMDEALARFETIEIERTTYLPLVMR